MDTTIKKKKKNCTAEKYFIDLFFRNYVIFVDIEKCKKQICYETSGHRRRITNYEIASLHARDTASHFSANRIASYLKLSN